MEDAHKSSSHTLIRSIRKEPLFFLESILALENFEKVRVE